MVVSLSLKHHCNGELEHLGVKLIDVASRLASRAAEDSRRLVKG